MEVQFITHKDFELSQASLPKLPKRHLPVKHAYVIIHDQDGNYLLRENGEPGIFGLPGGKLSIKEIQKPLVGVRRELLEETGIKINLSQTTLPIGFLYSGSMLWPKKSAIKHGYQVWPEQVLKSSMVQITHNASPIYAVRRSLNQSINKYAGRKIIFAAINEDVKLKKFLRAAISHWKALFKSDS